MPSLSSYHSGRFTRARLAYALACVAALLGRLAAGAGGADPAPPGVQEVRPELFYLRDDDGRLVPVPGFNYRDFVDLLRVKDGLPGLPQPPAAVLERVEVAGDLAPDGTAPCELTVTLRLHQMRGGWARVPLALAGFVVTAPPGHEGQGRLVLDTAQGGGYEAWVEAAADSRHTVTLVGVAAVERSPITETLRLDLPRATASLVRLRTPRESPWVDVRPVGGTAQVAPAAAGDSGSVVECAGLAGPAAIVVGARRDGERPLGAPPQAVVESLVRIDGTVASTTATVRLEGLAPDADEVQISLPPGMRLEGVAPPAVLLRVDGAADMPQAVIRVRPDAGGRAAIDLQCQRPIDGKATATIEPLGFAVAGIPAWRQRGRVSLVIDGDWQVDWDDSAAHRRVDPPVAARTPGFVAAFAYDSQPATLPLRVRPRGSRVVVEPSYRYDVGASRVGLVATLRVVVRGAPVSRVAIGIEGWNVDDVGPTSLVDAAAVSTEGGRLVIPFTQPLSGEATIEARCSMPIDRAATEVGWKLPVPRADLVGPAAVTIGSDSDIEILPDANAIGGLVRQVAAPPRGGEGPLIAYRLDGTEGTFAARRRFLPRRVDASVVAQATVGPQRTLVEETIRFDVAHVPLEFVDLAVARELLDGGTLEARQAGELLNPFEVSAAADAPAGVGTLRVMLANPLLGAGELTVTFSVPTPEVPPEATVGDSLPLALPLDARVVRQSFVLVSTDQFTVEVRGDTWTRDVVTQVPGPGRVWTASGTAAEVPLALAARSESATADVVVEAAWYETRLLPDRRDDLCTYAVTSAAPQVRLVLPAGYQSLRERGETPVQVRVDGMLVDVARGPDGVIDVLLRRSAGEPGARGCILEIAATRPRRGSGWTPGLPERLVLEPPRFPAGVVVRRFYWELRLESDEHVVVPPAAWTSQQRWRWGPFGPEYAPLVSHTALAEWIAATARRAATTPDMPVAERRLVYAGVGNPEPVAVWLAPTWLLVLVVSGTTLALGLAVVYRPAMRRVSVLLAVGAAAALAAALAPDRAPLFGLAALPGLLLALLAAGLRHLVDRPAARSGSPAVAVAAESSTRLLSGASIVIAPSAATRAGTVTTRGGDGS